MMAPYQLLTQAVEKADIAVKAATMIFINNFITSTQSLDDRVMVCKPLSTLHATLHHGSY